MIDLNQLLNKKYRAQVDLLLQILLYVAEEDNLALKGGTAINMFVWDDMPRLSVDIDLTYIPFDDRQTAIANIAASISRLKEVISKAIPGITTIASGVGRDQEEKLLCSFQGAQVKIEINTVMRGTLAPPKVMRLSRTVQQEFRRFVDIKVVSKGELFGGKICAALDRQHPRDLFDIHYLFGKGGITEDIKQGFIAALLSHPRPINEMFHPNFFDQKEVFVKQFQGMAFSPFTYADFEETRTLLVKQINRILTEKDKRFLLSFKSGEPLWELSDTTQLQQLPAVQWKLANIRKLLSDNPAKHVKALEKLQAALH
jgi:predicted nucleotidyltransferase component of viral defense system